MGLIIDPYTLFGGGSAPTFPDPADLGAASWLAQDLSTLTLNDVESVIDVVEWRDKIISGAAWGQIAAGQGPTRDATTGVISFNGTSAGLQCDHSSVLALLDGASSDESVTIMALARYRSGGAAAMLSTFSTTAANYRGGMGLSGAGTAHLVGRRGASVTGGTVSTDWAAYEAWIDHTTSHLKAEGSSLIAGADLTAVAVSFTHHTIGFRKSSSSGPNVGFAPIDLLEHVMFAGAATTEQIDGVRTYWAETFDLTAAP